MAATVQAVLQGDSSKELEIQKKRLRENCEEFQAVMVSIMMKTMKDGIIRAEEPGSAMGTYEDMMVAQVSKEVSRNSSLGLGDLLYSKLEPLVKVQAQKEQDLAASNAQNAVSRKQEENERAD